jgi:hypothetical protein
LPASTYLLFGSGVVLSGASEATVRLTSVGTTSTSQSILSYTLKKYKFSTYYFLLLTIFCSHLWISFKDCPRLDSRKEIPTGDNFIMRIWTNGMSCLHETQMKKNGMRRTMGGIDGGSTSMEALTDHLSRGIQYLMYHQQWRSLTWAIFLTYLTDSARYTEIYKIYISIYINR